MKTKSKVKKSKLNVMAFALMLLMCTSLESCYVTRTTVGNGPIGKDPNVKVYSKAKQVALISGLIAINQANPAKPTDGNYQIVTSFNLVDDIIKYITGSIVTTETVKVVVKNK